MSKMDKAHFKKMEQQHGGTVRTADAAQQPMDIQGRGINRDGFSASLVLPPVWARTSGQFNVKINSWQ